MPFGEGSSDEGHSAAVEDGEGCRLWEGLLQAPDAVPLGWAWWRDGLGSTSTETTTVLLPSPPVLLLRHPLVDGVLRVLRPWRPK